MKVLCSLCPLLLEKNSLKAHMRLHREVNSYSCEVCNKNFKVKSYFIEHMKTHDISFDCNLCDKKYPLKRNLKKHIMRTHQKSKYSCDFCKKDFASKDKCNMHMTRCHVDDPLPCTKCDAVFVSNKDLKKHFNKNHSISQCDVCLKEFQSMIEMEN